MKPERVRTKIDKDVTRAIGPGASMLSKPGALRGLERHPESNRIVTSDDAEPMLVRRTKSWILLSGAFSLWSNEYEKTYSFIDFDRRGRDAGVKCSGGIAQPEHDDATNLETEANRDATSSAAEGSAETGPNGR